MLTVFVSQLLVGMPTLVSAGPAPHRENQELVLGETIDAGIVIVEGRVLPGPYQVGSRRGAVFVNSQRVAAFQPGLGGRPRRSPSGPRIGRPAAALVASIERHLLNDEALLVFDQHTRVMCDKETAAGFLNELAQAESLQDQVHIVMETEFKGTESITTIQWRKALAGFQPTQELSQFLEEYSFDDTSDSEDDGGSYTYLEKRETNARRMYVLSTVGMALAVLSVGMLLSCRPESAGRWSQVADSKPRLRRIGRCLLLIVVLQAFDLLCTLIVGTTGHFEELNPLASTLMATPVALAAFKLASTVLGTGILWSLRRYVGAQVASWWLCLLMTILTARWVTVQSLFFT